MAPPLPGENGAFAGFTTTQGWIPPFQVSPRDQIALRTGVHWSPAAAAAFRLHYDWLWARWPDQTQESGSGDIRLGGAGRVLKARGVRPAIWLDSIVKLPNATDTSNLGTDETDMRVGSFLRWPLDVMTVQVGGGLEILGNPLMFANQDDAGWADLLVEKPVGESLLPFVHATARLASPRNPADINLAAGLEWSHGPWRIGGEVQAGVTPAAADLGASIWLGRTWTCADCSRE